MEQNAKRRAKLTRSLLAGVIPLLAAGYFGWRGSWEQVAIFLVMALLYPLIIWFTSRPQ
jgi:hypothetical protein